MPLSKEAMKNKQQYSIDYAKRRYKRVPLDVTLEKYDEIKKTSAKLNESVNQYIKKAIDSRIASGT